MALKGSAAFKYTPTGSTSQKTYNLNFPLELVPGGGLRAAHRTRRAIADSLTFGNREVIRTSSGVYELEARLRFAENAQVGGVYRLLMELSGSPTITWSGVDWITGSAPTLDGSAANWIVFVGYASGKVLGIFGGSGNGTLVAP